MQVFHLFWLVTTQIFFQKIFLLFYLPLFKSVAKNLSLGTKILEGHLPPPQVMPVIIIISGKSIISNRSTMYSRKVSIAVFYILLTVRLDAILGNDQLDAVFLNVFIYASTRFEQQVLIIRRSKLY
jgi:hypothetical protein